MAEQQSSKPGFPSGAERRSARRASLVTQIRTGPGGQTLVGYSRDISAGGVFVETEDPPPKGAELFLRFKLDPEGPIREARATVVYRLEGAGMGLRFLNPPADFLEAIQKFVAHQDEED